MATIDAKTQSLIDVAKGGAASWRDRLAGEIVLKSPEGKEFHALWRGSPRTMAKKLGVLKHPKIKGDIVQDMEVSSSLYSIPIYFVGANNDVVASAFFYACKERGQWEVTHPVHGLLGLQLVSVEEVDDPVESGNITEIKTEWIEPIDPVTLKTAREMKGIIDGKVDDLNATSSDQFQGNTLTSSTGLLGAITETVEAISATTKKILSPLTTAVDAIWNAQNMTQRVIQDLNNATVLQVESLVGNIQSLIELPVASNNSLESRVTLYASLADEFAKILPGGLARTVRDTASDDEKRNAIAVVELSLMASVAAMGGVISTTEITPNGLGPDDVGSLATRAQAIKAASDLVVFYNGVIDTMEAAQADFESTSFDKQFFSLLTSYSAASSLVYSAVEHLLTTALQLSIERRFTLDRPRAPIEITITEYGTLGEDDCYLDLFIRSNDLHGKDILLLPRGREVVVYV